MAITLASYSQNEITAELNGNELCVKNVSSPGGWFQYTVQNTDNFSEYVWFWSQNPDTCFVTPYCNARVGRTAFTPSGITPSNYVTIETITFASKVWWNGELNISLKGEWEAVKVTMWDLQGKQTKFQEGMEVLWDEEGMKSLHPIIRYGNINHPRILRFEYWNGECNSIATKIIYI